MDLEGKLPNENRLPKPDPRKEIMNVCIIGPSMSQAAISDFIKTVGKRVDVLMVDDAATEPRIEDMSLDSEVSRPFAPITYKFTKQNEESAYWAKERRRDDPWRQERKDKRFK